METYKTSAGKVVKIAEILKYDRNTGILRWLISPAKNVKIGDVAGCANNGSGYSAIRINKRNYMAHRLAWLIVYGKWPANQIDHINGNRADNRLSNLREATMTQNNRNKKISGSKSNAFKGAYLDKRSGWWSSRIGVDGTSVYLGCYRTGAAAHAAYCAAAEKHHGKFARAA